MSLLFTVLVVCLAICSVCIVVSVVKRIMTRVRFLRCKKRLLHLDFIEEYRSEDYRALLLRKCFEQDHLLRYRIVRSLDIFDVASTGGIVQNPRALIDGEIRKQRALTNHFPYLMVKKIETEISVTIPSRTRKFVIPDLPVELVRDAIDLRWMKRSLGSFL